MNQLQIFQSSQFGEVRVATTENNEPLFCLADICKILELQTNKVKERLSEKGWNTIPTLTSGGTQNLIYINESNFYKAVFQSRKPEAEVFTDWVTSEVLPTIRKHGAYMNASVIEKALTDPDTIIQLAINLKEERMQRQILQQQAELQANELLITLLNELKVHYPSIFGIISMFNQDLVMESISQVLTETFSRAAQKGKETPAEDVAKYLGSLLK